MFKPEIKSVRQDSRKTVCAELARYKSDDSFGHLLRSLFLQIISIRVLCHVSGVQLSCLNTSLKICFGISFVTLSQVLISSARIPLLSLALPFLSLWISV